VIVNPNICAVEFIELCMTDEPVKLWDVKIVEVHEEFDEEVVEKRDIDSGQKVLQILANALE